MKLVIAIVQDQDAHTLIQDATKEKFRVTKLSTSGGFLKSGSATLLFGVEEERLQELLDIIEHNGKSREVSTSLMTVVAPGGSYIPCPVQVQVGGATVFVLDVEQFHRF